MPFLCPPAVAIKREDCGLFFGWTLSPVEATKGTLMGFLSIWAGLRYFEIKKNTHDCDRAVTIFDKILIVIEFSVIIFEYSAIILAQTPVR